MTETGLHTDPWRPLHPVALTLKTRAFSGTKAFKPRLAVDEALLCLSVVMACKDGKWTKRKGNDATAW